jgi:hypothetical protein
MAKLGRAQSCVPLGQAPVGPLLDQIMGPVVSVTGDGAYDQDGVYTSVAQRHPEAAAIVPPRPTAVPGWEYAIP